MTQDEAVHAISILTTLLGELTYEDKTREKVLKAIRNILDRYFIQ